MAKRFTDTNKWKKPFLRSMKAPYKLLWLYILDECDHAGIWQVDFEVAQIKTGEKLNKAAALAAFGDRIFEFDGGQKWFVFDFIEFQYGTLNPLNRAHFSVITLLNKYGIDWENKPLTSPLQGAKDKDMDKDMDKDKGGVGENYYRVIKHLKLTHADFDKLLGEGWSADQVNGILDAIENYRGNTKYVNLLFTARKWLQKEYPPEKLNAVRKKSTANIEVKKLYQHEPTSNTGT